ncbi:hypothetical protein EHS13_34650 [Paenibacillus psychroresistens]|uniref:Uncharacterized protein n=1 Tax=Paenibacillus psychroresistens TaxID=1778678 RepID=A0A6B8RT72_9BACL|nr:hypothetical protein [Paenibacillus psychroresistens]QGQ99641.1 hypothetical protein EHS13_34650 [Paenibacillus psychroresistens]
MAEGGKRKKAFASILSRDSLVKTALWIIYMWVLVQFVFKLTNEIWEIIVVVLVCSVIYGFIEHFILKGINRVFNKR